MNSKTELKSQTVQSTMLLPLWGRATASEKNPGILYDKEAIEIINNCDYDFSGVAKTFGEFGGLCYVVRARKTEDTIRKFIGRHPRATIVNIGAGLDTTFSRVDNGTIRWYNLDLPDAIAFASNSFLILPVIHALSGPCLIPPGLRKWLLTGKTVYYLFPPAYFIILEKSS